MLRKDAEPDWENPTDEQTRAFETLKTRLISPRVLALPKAGRPYMIHTDVSVSTRRHAASTARRRKIE